MREGLLWFDADPKRSLASKVTEAAEHYRCKFGRWPDLCYINPITLGDGPAQCDGIRLTPSPNTLKNHFWIGVDELHAERQQDGQGR